MSRTYLTGGGIFLISVCCVALASKSYAQDEQEVVKYVVQKPEEVKRGETFQIKVLFNVAPNWYIYAPTGSNASQGMIETQVVLILPNGIKRSGKMKLPDPQFKSGHEVYEGDGITMSQTLVTTQNLKPGQYDVKGKVTWQTCNSDICLPPVTDEFVARITVQ